MHNHVEKKIPYIYNLTYVMWQSFNWLQRREEAYCFLLLLFFNFRLNVFFFMKNIVSFCYSIIWCMGSFCGSIICASFFFFIFWYSNIRSRYFSLYRCNIFSSGVYTIYNSSTAFNSVFRYGFIYNIKIKNFKVWF